MIKRKYVPDVNNPFGYVYLTFNPFSRKWYCGSHICSFFSKNYKGSGVILRKAFEKYGWDNFVTFPIEWVTNDIDNPKIVLRNLETRYLKSFDVLGKNSKRFYNIKDIATGWGLKGEFHPMYGKHHTDETKRKQSIKLRNRKFRPRTEEEKQKQREKMLGRTLSIEHRRKISESLRNSKKFKEAMKLNGKKVTFNNLLREYGPAHNRLNCICDGVEYSGQFAVIEHYNLPQKNIAKKFRSIYYPTMWANGISKTSHYKERNSTYISQGWQEKFIKYMKEHNDKLVNPFTNESIELSNIIL